MTELEKFHQYILFKMLDSALPEWATWVSVDKGGDITVFKDPPEIRLEDASRGGSVNISAWYINNNVVDQSEHWEYIISPNKTTKSRVICKVPEGIDWTECIWKL